ncbi:MAG TPA: amylo-alpha-1,6-glucosidase, partial [Nitrospirae bacterium]|nr:amylo-alpha-1,6-glucosidase [Nitrospirota bacterium]
WMEKYGDVDCNGFLEYIPHESGLINQGWKDSFDSIFHRNGTMAKGPIALCEVQGYQYAALREAALMAKVLGRNGESEHLSRRADILKKGFNETFWDADLGTYVLALDGKKNPCRVVSSNAGHALLTGIADNDKAAIVAETLTSDAMFSGWGIRTIGSDELLYNPMSYHNGSVWPHDNALIAAGLAAYGLREQFRKVFSGIFDASLFMEFQRLPELFCGFHRRKGASPTLFPTACVPQTWAAGAIPLLLQASLGLRFEADRNTVIFHQPMLPEFLSHVSLKNLVVSGKKRLDLTFHRYGDDVTIEIHKKDTDVQVLVMK